MAKTDGKTGLSYLWAMAAEHPVAAAVLVFGVVIAVLAFGYPDITDRDGGTSSDQTAEIARVAGFNVCFSTGYQITNRLDDSKRALYDCYDDFVEKHHCVTYEDGIARDETDSAKFLFEDQLNREDIPRCAR